MTAAIILERADLLLDQHRYKDAEHQIREALRLDPQNAEAYAMLARCYINNGQPREGIAAINEAIALDPLESFHFYLLAYAHHGLDENEAAIPNLEKAISLNPYAAEYHGFFAFLLLEQREYEKALEKANEGLALDPENLTCLNARSRALNRLRRVEAAIETMSEALAQHPDDDYTHTTVGWNYLERGVHQKARHHFVEALRINPNNEGARVGMKEALKSKIALYRWLLQYSFWMQNKGRRFQAIFPIALYVVFRILVAAFSSATSGSFTTPLIAIYFSLVALTWTIGSIANFVLLFDPMGKYALDLTERWTAITVVSSIVSGAALLMLHFSFPQFEGDLFLPSLILLSLSLPLSQLNYPLQFRDHSWHGWLALGLVAISPLAILFNFMLPSYGVVLFGVYAVGFLIYNWAGLSPSR